MGGLKVDLARKSVRFEDDAIFMTGKEYQTLALLVRRRGEVVTKMEILEHLYSRRDAAQVKVVDVYICALRKKLAHASRSYSGPIETVWGQGYRLGEAVG